MSASPLSLSVEGLQARLGRRTVLEGVAFTASGGQWLSVVGPNGAGKSTLLRVLAGLCPATGGRVSWMAGDGAAVRPLVAWLSQSPLADEAMTVRDTVALGRLPHQGWLGAAGSSPRDDEAIARALDDADMAWAMSRRVGELSGGERQRVALARALATEAPVLLLDEPASHLDAPHQRLLARVLRRQAAQGVCVIAVLHELPLALMGDALLVLQSGCTVMQGDVGDARVHRAVEAVFDQALRVVQVQGHWLALPVP